MMRKKQRGQDPASRQTEELRSLLSALSLEEEAKNIEALPDGRAQVLLRQTPYLALEIEPLPAPPSGFRARMLTSQKEEIFLLPEEPSHPNDSQPDGSQPDGSQTNGNQPDGNQPNGSQPNGKGVPETTGKAALLARLKAELGYPTSSAAEERRYRLKVSVLEDFTYLPRWQELGHTDVRIGGDAEKDADPAMPDPLARMADGDARSDAAEDPPSGAPDPEKGSR